MPEGDNGSLLIQKLVPANGDLFTRRARVHLLAAACYLVLAARTGGVGVLPVAVAAMLLIAGLAGARHRHAADVALPFALFAALYHGLGWIRPDVAARGVHVFFPYWFDKTVFGVAGLAGFAGLADSAGLAGPLSCNELFAIHHLPSIDFVTGVAYLSFLPCVVAFATCLFLFDRCPTGLLRARRFGWTFLGVNAAGFATYYLCPVAPPWYVAAHGFGPVDVATRASPAALARWDAMTGIPYFDRFYAQATEVFGALPSLHCAYPMLLVLFAWELRRPRLVLALVAYELLMSFSAVYLQHHYVTDVVAGVLYAAAGYGIGCLVAHVTLPATAPPLSRPGHAPPLGATR